MYLPVQYYFQKNQFSYSDNRIFTLYIPNNITEDLLLLFQRNNCTIADIAISDLLAKKHN